VVAALRGGLEDVEAVARAADLKEKTVKQYRRELADVDLDEPSTVCSLSWLRQQGIPREELKRHVEKIQHVTRYNRRSEPIAPPWRVTPELAEFVGLAISEARLGHRIKFYNTDDGLLERFEKTARVVFDVEPNAGEEKGVPFREIGTRTISTFLESCFDVFDRAAGGTGIGSTIVRADAESRAAFLRAVFDAEAHVGRGGTVELSQKNGELVTLISYLLSGFGIPTRRTVKRKSATNGSGIERDYHVLYLSGAGNLRRFLERVGFTIERTAGRLERLAAKDPNPNDDTIPVQRAVAHLCDALYLPKGELLTDSLNPESPGRENYLEDVDRVLDAASERLDVAQEALARVDRLPDRLDRLTAVPSKWVAERDSLSPIEVRRELSQTTGIRA
ncbi:MAG: LAGLIDADG family homing endonuclease, partial [Halobacteriales archaeon]|nr:LAGLIDADG family homing endonuclease [Halobacteriales archaeon]